MDVQAFVVKYPNLPMFCIGDLNNANEKLGPAPAHVRRISDFCCMVKNCGLFDLGYNGPAYTGLINVLTLIPLLSIWIVS